MLTHISQNPNKPTLRRLTKTSSLGSFPMLRSDGVLAALSDILVLVLRYILLRPGARRLLVRHLNLFQFVCFENCWR